MEKWWMDEWTDRWTGRWVGGWTDGWMDRWALRWMDGCRAHPAQCHLSPSAITCPTTPMCISAPITKASSRAAAFCLPPSLGGHGGTEGLVAPLGDAWAVRGSLLWEMPMGCRWSLGMGTLSCCGGSVPPPAAQWGSWALCRHQTHLGGTHGALPRRHPHRGAHRGPHI